MMNQLLELFISQTKGHKMEILKMLKSETSELVVEDLRATLPEGTKLERKIYYLDIV